MHALIAVAASITLGALAPTAAAAAGPKHRYGVERTGSAGTAQPNINLKSGHLRLHRAARSGSAYIDWAFTYQKIPLD